jgi:carboxylesterase type B
MFALTSRRLILLWVFGTAAYASVNIANGTVNGITDNASGIEKFLGIPFAEPPVGDRRLRQAAPLTQSFGTIEADEFGPSCISARDQGPESEDCLTLNIWRPLSAAKGNVSLPVLVWLYGGSLTSGYTVGSHSADIALRLIADVDRPILETKLPLSQGSRTRL